MGKKTNYEDADFKCPFYRGNKGLEIVCEGITERSVVKIKFDTVKLRVQQSDIFCKKSYEKCEIYKMLTEYKYGD